MLAIRPVQQYFNKSNALTVPVMVSEAWVFDDMGMTVGDPGGYGSVDNQLSMTVVGHHPWAAGLTGSVDVTVNPERIPGAAAIVAAQSDGVASLATLFGYMTRARL